MQNNDVQDILVSRSTSAVNAEQDMGEIANKNKMVLIIAHCVR